MHDSHFNERVCVRRSILALAAVAAALAGSAQVYAGCTVTKDDGGTYTDSGVASCGDYYPVGHYCKTAARNSAQDPNACARQDMFQAVDWNGVDMIINTHRGVWGMRLTDNAATAADFSMAVGGPGENSSEGVQAALAAGFHTVEYDILLARDDRDTSPVGSGDFYRETVVVSHFTDLAGFTDYGTLPSAHPGETSEIPLNGKGTPGFIMGERYDSLLWTRSNGSPYPRLRNLHRRSLGADEITDESLETLYSFIANMGYNEYQKMVVVLDPKWAKQLYQLRVPSGGGRAGNECIGFCGAYGKDVNQAEGLELLVKTVETLRLLQQVDGRDRFPQIIIKLPEATYPNVAAIQSALGSDFNRLLFAPQPDVSGKLSQSEVLAYIDQWLNVNSGKSVAFWDTSLRSTNHWMGKPFTVNSVTYTDLMDYLRQKSGKRSAIWAVDPAGPGGRNGNFAFTWTQTGNSGQHLEPDSNGALQLVPADVRGDGVYSLVFSGSKHAVITTDRNDLFLRIRNYLKTL